MRKYAGRARELLERVVKWIVEGEEEIGSAHFGEIIAPHAGLLRALG